MSAHCCHGRPLPCGCCEGVGARAPDPAVRNAPGLDAIAYRLGTHGSFMDGLLARLTTHALPGVDGAPGSRPLAALHTRRRDDPAIALLDAWATVADVLTFYAERIANEGYLRTAIERRSAVELGRLLGYRLRPALSASVFLAYTVDPTAGSATVEAGSRSMSVPAPGELPQTFETAEEFVARADWNDMRPRMTRPQRVDTGEDAVLKRELYVNGVTSGRVAGGRLVFELEDARAVRRIEAVETDPDAGHTKLVLTPLRRPRNGKPPSRGEQREREPEPVTLGQLLPLLRRPPSVPPPGPAALGRRPSQVFGASSDATAEILQAIDPRLGGDLYSAWGSAPASVAEPPRIYALRTSATPFGANAPLRPPRGGEGPPTEWPLAGAEVVEGPNGDGRATEGRDPFVLPLDRVYEGVAAGDWVVVERQGDQRALRVVSARVTGIAAYGMAGQVTELTLNEAWLDTESEMADLRATSVHLEQEALDLAEEPLAEPVAGGSIELDGLVEPPVAGRWLVVSGERADLPGVAAAELVMLAGARVTADRRLAGDLRRTVLTLATPLAYSYKRDTVHIRGNVVKATHGETKDEVLGSGDAAAALQSFTLAGAPLTYVPAANALGAASTLGVRVDGVLWHETGALLELGPKDRGYATATGDDDRTTVTFGDGVNGARVPSGAENIAARYRVGSGRGGNVRTGQVSQLMSRPLGVTEVVNPLDASGGADRETLASAKRSIPISVEALDRLVSVRDFEDFALARAGIGKASATMLSDGRRRFVHLTIAGSDDIPIAPTSDIYRTLLEALAACGDPHLQFEVQVRELALIALSAGVRVAADYEWAEVEPRLRAALLEAYGFERRELAEDVALSGVIAAMQGVRGVEYVDVDGLTTVPQNVSPAALRGLAKKLAPPPRQRIVVEPARIGTVTRRVRGRRRRVKVALPAQIALLSAAAPDMLLLREVRR